MKKIIALVLLVVLISTISFAETIQSERGEITVKDGDTLTRNSMWSGTVENLNDVFFDSWNFTRQQPHSEVFKNCTNLTFYKCLLTNVEIPKDSTVIDSLTIHREEKVVGNEVHLIIECGDNKTRTYKYVAQDLVEEELLELGIPKSSIANIKQSVVDTYVQQGKDVVDEKGTMELIDVKDTPSDKSYSGISRFIR